MSVTRFAWKVTLGQMGATLFHLGINLTAALVVAQREMFFSKLAKVRGVA